MTFVKKFTSPDFQAKDFIHLAKAGLRPARPRLDRRARVQFYGVLNVKKKQPGTMKTDQEP